MVVSPLPCELLRGKILGRVYEESFLIRSAFEEIFTRALRTIQTFKILMDKNFSIPQTLHRKYISAYPLI